MKPKQYFEKYVRGEDIYDLTIPPGRLSATDKKRARVALKIFNSLQVNNKLSQADAVKAMKNLIKGDGSTYPEQSQAFQDEIDKIIGGGNVPLNLNAVNMLFFYTLALMSVVNLGCVHGVDESYYGIDDVRMQYMQRIDAIEQRMLYVRIRKQNVDIVLARKLAREVKDGRFLFNEDFEPDHDAWVRELYPYAGVIIGILPPLENNNVGDLIASAIYSGCIRDFAKEYQNILDEASVGEETQAQTYERLFPWRDFEKSVFYQTRYNVRYKRDGGYIPEFVSEGRSSTQTNPHRRISGLDYVREIDDLEKKMVYVRMKGDDSELMLVMGMSLLGWKYVPDEPISMNKVFEEQIRSTLEKDDVSLKPFIIRNIKDQKKVDEIMKRSPFWQPKPLPSPYAEMVRYSRIENQLREAIEKLLRSAARKGETEGQTYERLIPWRKYKKSVYYQIEYGVQDIKEEEMLPQEDPEQENMDEQQPDEDEKPNEKTRDGSRPDLEPDEYDKPPYEDEKSDEEAHDGSRPDSEPDDSDAEPEESR